MFKVRTGSSNASNATGSPTQPHGPPPPPPPPPSTPPGVPKPLDTFLPSTGAPTPSMPVITPPPPPPPSLGGPRTGTLGGPSTPAIGPSAPSTLLVPGPPVLRDDGVLAPFVAKGVPRGAIKHISDGAFSALQGLERNKGDGGSADFALLKSELGPNADLIRAVFAQGGPHVKAGDAERVKLAGALNEGFTADDSTVESYRRQMSVLTEGKFEPYVKMANDHLSQNQREYPKATDSVALIHALPNEGKVALYKYTQEKFKPYNGLVLFPLAKSGDGPKAQALRTHVDGIAVTRSALNALPKFEGTVYRGDTKKYYDAYTQGAIITRDAFTSTAKNPDSKFDGDCILEIHTKTGRDIQGASLKPGEEEVLIPPGATFRVVERDDRGPVLRLKLEEL